MAAARPDFPARTYESARHGDNNEQENTAVNKDLILRGAPQRLIQDQNASGADDRSGQRCGAAEQKHGDQHDRNGLCKRLRHDIVDQMHVGRSGKAGEEGADGEGQYLVGPHVDPHTVRRVRIFTDGNKGASRAGVDEPLLDDKEQRHDQEHENIVFCIGIERVAEKIDVDGMHADGGAQEFCVFDNTQYDQRERDRRQ